jgi:hypothetical protein
MEADSSQRPDETELCDICRQHILEDTTAAIVPEPYIPYFPEGWNGLLVLAEAQNLAGDRKYQEWLCDLPPDQRFRRLRRGDRDQLGVQPWDDGSLKIAVAAALEEEPDATAVSNAVPWSLADSIGRNANPSKALRSKAVEFWADLLPRVRARRIVAVGNVAFRAMERALERSGEQDRPPLTHWWHPSPRALSPRSSKFSVEEMLARFPVIALLKERHKDWFEKYEKNKVYFACRAISPTFGDSDELAARPG